jgi:hypothetical protein
MSDKFCVHMLHSVTMRFWRMYLRETPREGEILSLKDESFRVDRVTRLLNESGELNPYVFLVWADTSDLAYDPRSLAGWRLDKKMEEKA